MQPSIRFLLIAIATLLSGCGGAPQSPLLFSAATPAQPPNIAGNWQFFASSSATPLFGIAGSFTQAGTSNTFTGALHVNGSSCFDPLTILSATANLNTGSNSIVITGVNNQTIMLTGNLTDTAFVGTYKVSGGCASGDQGNVTGNNIPFLPNELNGVFTNSAHRSFKVAASVAQSAAASSAGTFAIEGTAKFDTPCFASGTVVPGMLPSGSYISGISVELEFSTTNGSLVFLGVVSANRTEITGTYTISGGTCSESGTAVLETASPWDY